MIIMRKVIIAFSILVFSIRLQVFLFLYQLMLMYAIKGNKPVTFATDGTVLSGTIDEEVTVSVNRNKYGLITFERPI